MQITIDGIQKKSIKIESEELKDGESEEICDRQGVAWTER